MDRGVAFLVALVLAVPLSTASVAAQDGDYRIEGADLGMIHLFGVDEFVTISLEMEIESRGSSIDRSVDVYIHRDDRDQQVFAQVTNPPFLNRTRFLYVDRDRGRSSRWMANSQGVRRIADANGDESIFGSDFTAQDLSFIDIDEMEIAEQPSSDGLQRFLLSDPSERVPTRIVTYDPGEELVIRVEYLRGTTVYKRFEVFETRRVNGSIFPWRMRMERVDRETRTEVTIRSIDNTTPIPERTFNAASLR